MCSVHFTEALTASNNQTDDWNWRGYFGAVLRDRLRALQALRDL